MFQCAVQRWTECNFSRIYIYVDTPCFFSPIFFGLLTQWVIGVLCQLVSYDDFPIRKGLFTTNMN